MTKRKTSRNKKITLEQFRSWLAGVESMQPDDWTPSLEQWKKIREQISSIKEAEIPKSVVPQASVVHNQTNSSSPSTLIAGDVGLPPPAILGSQRLEPPVNVTSQVQPTAPFAEEGRQVVTPTIDTSDGTYVPPFE